MNWVNYKIRKGRGKTMNCGNKNEEKEREEENDIAQGNVISKPFIYKN